MHGHISHGHHRPAGDRHGPLRARHPLAMVYGGGGVFGIAYTSGVARGLADSGLPVRSAPALGTSAGSWTAASVALGVTYDDFDGLAVPAVPTRRAGVLAEIARELFGEARHELVSVSAVCVRSRRRHVLHGGRYPLADLVAASSAVPGLLPPHRIDGRLYIDGGLGSATSLDAVGEAEHVVVVAPLAGTVMGPMGRAAGFLLDREVDRWSALHPGSTVTTIRPDRAIAKVAGLHPLALFDEGRAREVFPMAHEQGLRIGALLAGTATAVVGAGTAA